MHESFKIGGIAHYHSHQVLMSDVKVWNFYMCVFRFLSFPFQLGFLTAEQKQSIKYLKLHIYLNLEQNVMGCPWEKSLRDVM